MLTTEECPEMNVGTGKFSDDVEMTVEYDNWSAELLDIGRPMYSQITHCLSDSAST